MKKRYLKMVAIATVVAMLVNMISAPNVVARIPEEGSPLEGKGCESCDCGGSIDQELLGKVKVEELTSSDLDKAVSEALSDENVKVLQKFLVGKGYKLQVKKATARKYTLENGPETLKALWVNMPLKGNSSTARIVFVTDYQIPRSGATITEKTADGQIISVFQPKEGAVVNSVTVKIDADGSVIVSAPDGQKLWEKGAAPTGSSWQCAFCLGICNLINQLGCEIVLTIGCLLVCVEFGPLAPACFVICESLALIMCVWSITQWCQGACQLADWCP